MRAHPSLGRLGSLALVLGLGLGAGSARAQLGIAGFRLFDGPPDSLLGSAVAVGDFNADGYDDLAVGMPESDVGAAASAGAVLVFLGGSGDWLGLEALSIESLGGVAEGGARFGAALAAGDFDNDGHDDLAVGVPNQDVNDENAAGEVVIAYGNATSRATSPGRGVLDPPPFDFTRTQFFSQVALPGAPEAGDRFGFSLAAGDLSADGLDDLAIGVPFEGIQGPLGVRDDAGAINILYSIGAAGLSTVGSQIIHENTPGVGLNANADERFGFSLAIGQLTGNADLDLAVGVPREVVLGPGQHGAVVIFPGAPGGIDPVAGTEAVFSQNTAGVLGTLADGDDFGYALAVGNFDGDLWTDLAIGVPGESELGADESGAVQVLYGNAVGLTTGGDQFFVESSFDTDVDDFDRLGRALAADDFNGDGRDDLAIGAPFDNSLGFSNAGEVDILYGTANGLAIAGGQVFNMIFFDTFEAGDQFGAALATGRFFSRSAEGRDLAVGVPRRGDAFLRQPGGPPFGFEPGAFVVIRSRSIFADGFESGDLGDWSGSP